MKSDLAIFAEPTSWPRANYSPVALMRHRISDLERLLGVAFARFIDENEKSAGVAIETAARNRLILVQHLGSESSPSLFIALDGRDEEKTLNAVLNELGLNRDDVVYGHSHGYTMDQLRDGQHIKR